MPLLDENSDSSGSSNEDHDLTFNQAVCSHGADLLQSTGMMYAEPISTPIISQLKMSVCKDIWKNNCGHGPSPTIGNVWPGHPIHTTNG
ncbi:hypothetical protein DPMN_109636 [Dreissena polymorpha]|uniref:Uncharacterized protein n=1 Tax=Dreissena polymorpha TaxID=45954 RepID=A0A9D4QM60_DREPO|nr:hypothetical protein DPMN_109636 [Dreissena polymorpha]